MSHPSSILISTHQREQPSPPHSNNSLFPCFLFVHVCMLSCFSRVWLFATLWAVDHQAPLSMEFSRQEYWTAFLCPSKGDLPDPGIELSSLLSPALAGWFFTTSATSQWKWKSHSPVQLWTVACQAPLSIEFSGQNTGVDSHSLLQGIFPTQGSNPGLPHCRRTLPSEIPGKPKLRGLQKLKEQRNDPPGASETAQLCWKLGFRFLASRTMGHKFLLF